MPDASRYRDFQFPLNVFMHILTAEEGSVRYLHYGLFSGEDEALASAQERSTELLLSRLPPPPARILDAGAGLGTTLARLAALGYDAEGISPDAQQVAMIRERHGERIRVARSRFEDWSTTRPYAAILFQESSQYIDSGTLFARARELTTELLVLDEFATRALADAGSLHTRADFLTAAAENGFEIAEEIDLSDAAAPTIDYIPRRLPRHADSLVRELGVTQSQLDQLMAGGETYRRRYADGTYVYRLLHLKR